MKRCAAGLALLALAACGQQPAKPTATPSPAQPGTVHAFMTERVDPYADIIWGIGNAAMNADAAIDSAKISPEKWREMAETAEKMREAARALSSLHPIRVVAAGGKIVDEGKPRAPIAAHVQAHLDANPDLFRSMAKSLEDHGRDLAVAARAQDAPNASRLVDEIDGVCEGCHIQFWYPEERALREAMMHKPQRAAKQ